MAPNCKEKDLTMGNERSTESTTQPQTQTSSRAYNIVYYMVVLLAYGHIGALYGLYLSFTSAKWATILLNYVFYLVGGWGVSAGAHRLWSQRSYKANLPLQILLVLFQSLSCQGSVIRWARDDRLHQQYHDTDGDPYNSTRGFLYSHIGWLMVRKHPEVIKRAKEIDMSDLYGNPVLRFQKKYYLLLSTLLVPILPTLVPVYFWQETFNNAYHVSLFRLIIGFHVSSAINSTSNFGKKSSNQSVSTPYDDYIFECNFPFQYQVSEMFKSDSNVSTKFIDFFGYIGWAYDLKRNPTSDIAAKDFGGKQNSNNIWKRNDDMVENKIKTC